MKALKLIEFLLSRISNQLEYLITLIEGKGKNNNVSLMSDGVDVDKINAAIARERKEQKKILAAALERKKKEA